MVEYQFYIRRTHNSKLELISIKAKNSVDAVNKLPFCVSWNFANNQK